MSSDTIRSGVPSRSAEVTSQSAARVIPFIGKMSAALEQQVKVWDQLDSVEPLSSALACTVMLHSKDRHMEEFVSAARPITMTDLSKLKARDIWTTAEQHANVMVMQKLWRRDNRQELNSKRREARQSKKNGSQKSSSPSSSVSSDCDGESIQPLKELQANHVQHSTNTKSGPSREHGRKRPREEAPTEHEPAGAIDREDGPDVSMPEGNSELIKKQKVADQPRTSDSVSTTPVGQKPNTHAVTSLIQNSPRPAATKSPAAPAVAIVKSNVDSDDGGPECHKKEERERDWDEGQNCAKNPAAEEEPEEDSEEDEDEEEEDDEEEEEEEEEESDSDDGKESNKQFVPPRRTEAFDEYMRAVKTGSPSHQLRLAMYFCRGTHGAPLSIKAAEHWLVKAARGAWSEPARLDRREHPADVVRDSRAIRDARYQLGRLIENHGPELSLTLGLSQQDMDLAAQDRYADAWDDGCTDAVCAIASMWLAGKLQHKDHQTGDSWQVKQFNRRLNLKAARILYREAAARLSPEGLWGMYRTFEVVHEGQGRMTTDADGSKRPMTREELDMDAAFRTWIYDPHHDPVRQHRSKFDCAIQHEKASLVMAYHKIRSNRYSVEPEETMSKLRWAGEWFGFESWPEWSRATWDDHKRLETLPPKKRLEELTKLIERAYFADPTLQVLRY